MRVVFTNSLVSFLLSVPPLLSLSCLTQFSSTILSNSTSSSWSITISGLSVDSRGGLSLEEVIGWTTDSTGGAGAAWWSDLGEGGFSDLDELEDGSRVVVVVFLVGRVSGSCVEGSQEDLTKSFEGWWSGWSPGPMASCFGLTRPLLLQPSFLAGVQGPASLTA